MSDFETPRYLEKVDYPDLIFLQIDRCNKNIDDFAIHVERLCSMCRPYEDQKYKDEIKKAEHRRSQINPALLTEDKVKIANSIAMDKYNSCIDLLARAGITIKAVRKGVA